MEPSFYAVIPATVRYCTDVPDGAKLLYGEIVSMCDKKGYCHISHISFARLYNRSEKTIGRWVSALAMAGFILTIADNHKGDSRKVWLPESQKK